MSSATRAPYTYLIRPDGSIRVSTRGRVLPNDTDFVYKSHMLYKPGNYRWDFSGGVFVEIEAYEKAAKGKAASDARAEVAAGRAKKAKDFNALLRSQDAKTKELFLLFAELAGIELE